MLSLEVIRNGSDVQATFDWFVLTICVIRVNEKIMILENPKRRFHYLQRFYLVYPSITCLRGEVCVRNISIDEYCNV